MTTMTLQSRPTIDPPDPAPLPVSNTNRSDHRQSWISHICSACEWLFGAASMVFGLSILATVPVLQLMSLGYLLEVGGRVVRSGRLRDGFIGVRKAARLGSIVLGTWLVFWPARAASGLWYSSLILNGHDTTTSRWRVAVVLLTVLTMTHVIWAMLRGGRLRDFAWPAPRRLYRRLNEGGLYHEARDRCWSFLSSLRLDHYFQLGLRGGLGAFVWLIVPVTLLVSATRVIQPLGSIFGILGAIGLATVITYLPFLQVRFAASGEFADLFRIREVRQDFTRAPIAFWIALITTLVLALPLYLLKAELIPREATWLPSLFFVTFALPARWLTGWAVARANKQPARRHWFFRWLSRLSIIPLTTVYVFVVYFTQYVSWYGGLSLYEQHAFLLPVPFLGS